METKYIEKVNKIILKSEEEINKITGMSCSLLLNLEADVSILEVRKLIEREMNVTYKEIAGRSRIKQIVVARYIYIWFLRKHYKKTLLSIANELNRDHTSIIHAMNAMQQWVDTKDYLVCIPLNHIHNLLIGKQNENSN